MTMERDERGSIPLFMVVMLVATALITATVVTVEADLKSSRRAGDSANALQVADAGINDAMQQAPTIPSTQGSFTRTVNLGDNGTYTYTATRDVVRRDLWHIDSVGTDLTQSTQVKRRIMADAVPTSLFNSPLFVNSTLNFSSGIALDSFSHGLNAAGMCTKKGIIGTNDPGGMTFGSSGQGQGVNNCQKLFGLDPSWDYSMDGCTSFGDGTQALPPTGTGKCPIGVMTFRTPPKKFTPPAVCPPGSVSGACYNPTPADFTGSTLTCDPSKPATGGPNPNVTSLAGGKSYYYTGGVTLHDGCRVINPVMSASGVGIDLEKPVSIYSSRVDIGNPNGQGGSINQPPAANATVCGSTAGSTQVDPKANPAYFYCPGWSGGLRIKIIGAGTANIRSSGTKFWGSVEAPDGTFSLNGSQIEVWGASVSNTGSSNAQFSWHFDDALSTISAGQYSEATWREVGV
ncbi:MAG TPA: hypothetical protein VNA57_06455 [Acidimicrobiales bacterium]|nr:hypothetical protein [Acidimicrobiales bacterium]